MAAYPSLPITINSRQTIDPGRVPVRATNGALKIRELAEDKSRFELEHELTSAQKTTLAAFYGTDKDLDVTFTWDGTAYTVRFLGKPVHIPQAGGWYKSYVTLLQV